MEANINIINGDYLEKQTTTLDLVAGERYFWYRLLGMMLTPKLQSFPQQSGEPPVWYPGKQGVIQSKQ